MIRSVFILGLAALAASCATDHSLYSWGRYEQILYSTYAEPGKIPPEQQISMILEDMQKGNAANKPSPPGLHAYLGSLYAETGKPSEAKIQFLAEKAEFPESSVLMDRFISNLPK
jgi:hypothetical protein